MSTLLTQGVAAHQAGRLDEAQTLYRRIIESDPGHADAWHLLGVAAYQNGQGEEAVARIRQALALKPDFAEAHSNLGNAFLALGHLAEAEICGRTALMVAPALPLALNNLSLVLRTRGQIEEAERCCRRALALDPDYLDARCNLADTLYALGRLTEAEDGYRRVVALTPRPAKACNNLGNVLKGLRRLGEAEAFYRQAAAIQPDFAEAHSNLGNLLNEGERFEEAEASCRKAVEINPNSAEARNNLGNALLGLGRLAEAEASYGDALAIRPDVAETHSNLGNAFNALRRSSEAEDCHRRALMLDPGYALAYSNLGNALRDLGRLEEAEGACRRALVIEPDLTEAHSNLGATLKDLGRLEDAGAQCLEALRLRPGFAMARANLAFTLFARGDIGAAWDAYEARWRQPDTLNPKRPFFQPWWRGEPLGGKEILIWGEQGLGDQILGASMLPGMTARGGKVLLECDGRLVDLFARSFPGAGVIPSRNPPSKRSGKADFQSPMFGLGRHLRPKLSDFPPHHGYLVADKAKRGHWKAWLGTLGPGRKVGISWRGRLIRADRPRHFVPLEWLAEILSIPGLVFVNLQYDGYHDDIAALRDTTGHIIQCPPDLDLTNDIDGCAALTAELDAVIGPATAVGLLAGALGIPTWMYALFPGSNEKEILGLDHVPWCPSIHVEKHGHGDDWGQTLSRIAQGLRAWCEAEAPLTPYRRQP